MVQHPGDSSLTLSHAGIGLRVTRAAVAGTSGSRCSRYCRPGKRVEVLLPGSWYLRAQLVPRAPSMEEAVVVVRRSCADTEPGVDPRCYLRAHRAEVHMGVVEQHSLLLELWHRQLPEKCLRP